MFIKNLAQKLLEFFRSEILGGPLRLYLATVLVTFVLTAVLIVFISIVAKKKTQLTLNLIEERLKTNIVIGDQRLSLGNAKFESISMHDDYDVDISQLSANINLNPLSFRLGKLKTLAVEQVRVRIPYEKLSSMLHGFEQTPPAGKTPTPDAEGFSLENNLPEFLDFNNGVVSITGDHNEVIYELSGLYARYNQGSSVLNFGFEDLKVKEASVLKNVRFQVVLDGNNDYHPFLIRYVDQETGKTWDARGRLKRNLSSFKLYLKRRGLPRFLQDLVGPLLHNSKDLNFALKLIVSHLKKEKSIQFGIHGGTTNLQLKHEVLARNAVGPVPVQVKALGFFHPESGRFKVSRGAVVVSPPPPGKKPVELHFKGERASIFQGKQPWKISFQLKDAPCQEVKDVMPNGLIPRLASFKLRGKMQLAFETLVYPEKKEAFDLKLTDNRFGCIIEQTDPEFSVSRITNFPSADPNSRFGKTFAIDNYAPFNKLSKYIPLAFIASEDTGFWKHDGIEFGSLKAAIKQNIEHKRVEIGGSTITMQTAKNLFLSQERTVARKLQELFLSWYLESAAPKEKIFEIYANIIEYGPGIFGIENAAKHFFNKNASQLTLLESAYLASILPSPLKRYEYYCRGILPASYREQINHKLEKMFNLNMIDGETYDKAIQEPLHFYLDTEASQECHKRLATREVKRRRR